MRDPRWTLVAGLTCLTSASLGLTGEVTRAALLVPLAAALGARRLRRRAPEPGRLFHVAFQALALGALLFFLTRVLRLDLLGGAVALTLPVQAYYLALPPTHRLLVRLQVLSFFQLIALAATTTTIFFAVALVAYVACSPAALTLAALEAGRRPRRPLPLPAGAWRPGLSAAALGLGLGAALFVLLPRYEAGFGQYLSDRDRRLSGFSDRVRLGDIGRIKTSAAVVMRVRLDRRLAEPPRWRGLALDHFDGRTWRRGEARTRTLRAEAGSIRVAEAAGEVELVRQDFVLEPLRSRAVFSLADPVRVRTQDFRELEQDVHGSLERWFPGRSRVEYAVWSALEDAPGPAREEPAVLERCLQLPDLDPRVHELAASVTAGAGTPERQARRLEAYLRRAHAYTLDVRDEGLDQPIVSFLLERRPGHCEYFATGMTVLARSLGLPARVVNGFQAGTWSRLSRSFVVRQRDAHSWVEVWLPDRGWTTFDPTPAEAAAPAEGGLDLLQELWTAALIFWDDNVVGFSFNHQLSALTVLGEWRAAVESRLRHPAAGRLLAAAALASLLGAGLLARWGRRRRLRPALAFYDRALRLLERRGLSLRPGQTPGELAAEARRRGGPAGEAAVELTEIYYEARFAGRSADRSRVGELLLRLRDLPDLRRQGAGAATGSGAPPAARGRGSGPSPG